MRTCLIFKMIFPVFLLKDGDIESNPPKNRSHCHFPYCHWNVNSQATDNYCNASTLKAYNATHKYDFIYANETFFDSSIKSNDKDLQYTGII